MGVWNNRNGTSGVAPLVAEYAASQQGAAGQQQGPMAVRPVNVFGGEDRALGAKPYWASLSLSEPRGKETGTGPVVKVADNGPRYASLGLSGPGVQAAGAGDGGTVASGGVATAAPVFEKDEGKRDGGFFGWLGGLSKKRPGRRAGETDDEYDERMTRNNVRIATLADAIRHMGNIYNTMKGGLAQEFNSPASVYEQGLEKRKAERAQKSAAAQAAAYKAATLQMKADAQKATNAYREATLGFKRSADERARENMKFQQGMTQKQYERAVKNDEFNHGLAADRLAETKRHNGVSEGQGAARIRLAAERNAISRANGGGRSGGSGSRSVRSIPTPNGVMTRNNEPSAIEKKAIARYLIENGWIDDNNMKTYNMYLTGGDSRMAGDMVNSWIGYAAYKPGKKGDAFRAYLRKHYRYAEDGGGGFSKPSEASLSLSKPSGGKAQGDGNPIRWQGAGKAQGKQQGNGKAQKQKSGTDWSKYVK